MGNWILRALLLAVLMPAAGNGEAGEEGNMRALRAGNRYGYSAQNTGAAEGSAQRAGFVFDNTGSGRTQYLSGAAIVCEGSRCPAEHEAQPGRGGQPVFGEDDWVYIEPLPELGRERDVTPYKGILAAIKKLMLGATAALLAAGLMARSGNPILNGLAQLLAGAVMIAGFMVATLGAILAAQYGQVLQGLMFVFSGVMLMRAAKEVLRGAEQRRLKAIEEARRKNLDKELELLEKKVGKPELKMSEIELRTELKPIEPVKMDALPARAPEVGNVPYSVRDGDALWKISQREGVPIEDLIGANPQLSQNGRTIDLIFPGETLNIPRPVVPLDPIVVEATAQPIVPHLEHTIHTNPPIIRVPVGGGR